MADFTKALAYILPNEGGAQYTNVPTDRGGPTKYGITLNTLIGWRKKKGLPFPTYVDVQGLTIKEMSEIYLNEYWLPLGLNDIADQKVATAIFDCAVNDGVKTSALMAQVAANSKPDGVIGVFTKSAINTMDPKWFLAMFITQVQNHYIEIVVNNPSQITYLRGWLHRSQRLMIFMT